ncbi:MAG: class I SAM-dependent methyltransferase [Deltaproteobacteria bacterium]|nr:class I SAM-dependent methyltransferase [Deltaproteobacteria bacterium]
MPMPDLDQVRDFWTRNLNGMKFLDAAPKTAMEFRAASTLRYRYHYHLPGLFDRVAREYPGGRLLEIGCGMGDDTAEWVSRGMLVTAIDLTKPAVDTTRKRLALSGMQADVKLGNAEALDFPAATFDVVYSFGVLHHSPDTERTIEEVRRVLRPGGKAEIMLYHRASLNYVVHRVLSYPFDGTAKDPCPVEHTYSRRQIREMFARFSRSDIEVEYLFGTGYGLVNRLLPRVVHRKLGRLVGWHLMIEATK